MMTSKEYDSRYASLSKHWFALSASGGKYLNEHIAISEYGRENKLPMSILRHVWAASDARWELFEESVNLRGKIDEAQDAVRARPYLLEIGNGASVKCKGSLPNGEGTSTDEATALKMYAAYKAAKAFELRDDTEELPF